MWNTITELGKHASVSSPLYMAMYIYFMSSNYAGFSCVYI